MRDPPKRKRRWYQFSVWILLIVVASLSVLGMFRSANLLLGERGISVDGPVWETISLGFVAVEAALVCICTYIFVTGTYYQGIVGPALERDLGFKEGKVHLIVGRRLHGAVAIKNVVPGGVFDKAGLRVGDVLPWLSHTDLFRLLHRSRGHVAELSVVDGGEGPPFEERPARVIRFDVPRREGT